MDAHLLGPLILSAMNKLLYIHAHLTFSDLLYYLWGVYSFSLLFHFVWSTAAESCDVDRSGRVRIRLPAAAAAFTQSLNIANHSRVKSFCNVVAVYINVL